MTACEFLEYTDIVFFIQGVNEKNVEIYVYLAVKSSNILKFLQRSQELPLALDQFGTILATGDGLPSQEVRHRMKTQYGFKQEDIIAIPLSTQI